MKLWHKHRKEAGDTIVEVLIAVTVISMVLTGAFLVAQKSTLAVRDSQEHAEMSQILQGQIELVRSLALAETDPNGRIFDTTPKYFCIDTDSSSPTFRTRVDSTVTAVTDVANYNTKCKAIQNFYDLAVSFDTATHVFTFYGSWDGVKGGRNTEQMSYRIYPGKKIATAPAAFFKAPDPSSDGDAALASIIDASPGLGCLDQHQADGTDPYPECWRTRIDNASVNPPGSVDHCTISWGDGSPIEAFDGQAIECKNGTRLGPHTYPQKGTATNKANYTVTITNYFTNGTSPKKYDFGGIFVPRN
jgi:Tfp pilus assembly protein PilV